MLDKLVDHGLEHLTEEEESQAQSQTGADSHDDTRERDETREQGDNRDDPEFVGWHGTNLASAIQVMAGKIRSGGRRQLGSGFYVYDKNRPSETVALDRAQYKAGESSAFTGEPPIVLRIFATGYPEGLLHTEVSREYWWSRYEYRFDQYDYLTSIVDGELVNGMTFGQVKFNQRAFRTIRAECRPEDQIGLGVCP